MLFYVLTRVSPFLRDSSVGTMFAHVNEPPPSLVAAGPGLPPALGEVVERALAKQPGERQQTAGEFAREAAEALAAAPAADAKSTPRRGRTPASTPAAKAASAAVPGAC